MEQLNGMGFLSPIAEIVATESEQYLQLLLLLEQE